MIIGCGVTGGVLFAGCGRESNVEQKAIIAIDTYTWTTTGYSTITLNANGGKIIGESTIYNLSYSNMRYGKPGGFQQYWGSGRSWFKTTSSPNIDPFISSVLKPTKSGYTFLGYYTSASGGTQVIDSTGKITASVNTYTSNATWYAHWQFKTPDVPSRTQFYAYGNDGTVSPPRGYNVNSISLTYYGYGFKTNSAGYLESQNKGVASSYSMVKIRFYASASGIFTIKYISSGESSYDYAIFSNLDSALQANNMEDTSYFKSAKGEPSTAEKSVTYSVSSGWHDIYVKYRKDGSVNNGNDSVQLFFETDWSGSGNSSSTYQFVGMKYGTLPTATRTGYTFGGWWTASSGGTQITSNSIYNGSNIYAHWLVNVSFDSENIYDDYGWSCAGENVSVNFSKGFDDNGQVFTYCYINSFNSNNDGGPYFSKERLIVGETYIWRVDLKSTRAHDLYNVGHEQGGLISVSVNTNWKSFTHEFVATGRECNAFVIYGGYTAGETLSVANLTIQKKSDVSFDTAVYNLKKSPNKAYGHLPTPERSGWTFDGWFDSSISGVEIGRASCRERV